MITKLLNLLLMLFGFTQATKQAAIATSPAAPVDAVPDTPPVPTPTAVPVAAPLVANHFAYEKPVRDFQAKPHRATGSDKGYRTHSEDRFKNEATTLRADFTQAVTDTVRQIDQTILACKKALNECGDMSPTHKANLELELEHLISERAYWESQLTLTQSDPKSEYAASYEQLRGGYEDGMKRYHDDKRYGDANGLAHLIP